MRDSLNAAVLFVMGSRVRVSKFLARFFANQLAPFLQVALRPPRGFST